jgi:hypothetical protein
VDRADQDAQVGSDRLLLRDELPLPMSSSSS